MITRRSGIAALMACLTLLVFTAPAYPSYNSEAGRKYSIASQRLADLRKSNKKKKYRSYWVDCIRTFEVVEKKYPKSPSAVEACLDRAGLYFELYQFSRYSRDLDASILTYEKCQSAYSTHQKAPEALYRSIELSLEYKKNHSAATKTYKRLADAYPQSEWTDRAKTRLGVSPAKRETEIRKMPASTIKTSGKEKPEGIIKSVRYRSGGTYTRIVIDQSKELKYEVQELKNPDRLVFNIFNSRIDASIEKTPLPVHDGILQQVRVSQYAPDVVRVVLDLANIKSYVAFPLQEPTHRLVIDVMGEKGGNATGGAISDSTKSNEGNMAINPGSVAASKTPVPSVTDNDYEKLSLSQQMGLKIKTIAIDPGHGGRDPGAIGKNGLKEKNVTLDIAKRLAKLVKERLGVNVVMTRNKDVFIPLEDRPAIARTKDADLFVSIHVNATKKRNTRGIETYIQGLRASDREAMATAARENATTQKTLNELDDELSLILKGLTMGSNDNDSVELAHAVQISLVNTVKPIQGHVVNLGVKRAFFYVLINTGMPSILAEVGFISNPTEEKLLRQESYRQNIAEALYQGVKKYIEARSPQLI